MKKYIKVTILCILSNIAVSGECEKEKARESIICLENKISELTQHYRKLDSRLHSILLPTTSGSGKINVVNVLKNLPQPKITATHTSNSFQIDVVNCKHQRDSVDCSLLVTNKGDDTDFFISNNTKAYNEFGEPFNIGNTKIVNKSVNLTDVNTINHRLIKNVPVKVEIEFVGVNSKSTQFTLIDLVGYRGRIYNHPNHSVLAPFRNVALAP